MTFGKPSNNGFTIYSKSGCYNCLKVKLLLEENNALFNVVDCDEYIIENKNNFLLFINELSDKNITVFPIVFYYSYFIGSYTETKKFLDELRTAF